MKITWITTKHPPDIGGMARSSERLVNNLRLNGHLVEVLHLTPEIKSKDLNLPRKVMNTVINPHLEPERLFWLYREKLADSIVVGFGGDLAGFLATLWAKWMELKSIVLFRGNDFDKIINDVRRAYTTLFILEKADTIGCVSTEMVRRIQTLRNGRTVFTPNSINTTSWKIFDSDLEKINEIRAEKNPNSMPIISLFGELKAKKGLEMAIEIFCSFEFKKISRLMTVGNIPESFEERLQNECGDSWIRISFKDREELPVYYALSDIVFIPSLYDGMPNTLLEAMALGKIIVASKGGAIPDVITHGVNGFLFDIGDIMGAAKALECALNLNKNERTLIQKNARTTIENNFQPEKEIEIIENELKALEQR